jgi:hypothetical protein
VGTRSVVAVEIDPAILRWPALAPQAPYRDPGSHRDRRCPTLPEDKPAAVDLIVFSHLTPPSCLRSPTFASTLHLPSSPGGPTPANPRASHLSFFHSNLHQRRLYRNLTLAFGHPPVSLDEADDDAPGLASSS